MTIQLAFRAGAFALVSLAFATAVTATQDYCQNSLGINCGTDLDCSGQNWPPADHDWPWPGSGQSRRKLSKGTRTLEAGSGQAATDVIDPTDQSHPRNGKFWCALRQLAITHPEIACAIMEMAANNSLSWLELDPSQPGPTGRTNYATRTIGIQIKGRRSTEIATTILHEFEHVIDHTGNTYGETSPGSAIKEVPQGGWGGSCAHSRIHDVTSDRLCDLAAVPIGQGCEVFCVDLEREWIRLANAYAKCLGIMIDPGQLECPEPCLAGSPYEW